jgi:hypothetical protein
MPMWVSAARRAKPKADATASPIVIRHRHRALPGVLVLAIGAVWCALPIRGLLIGTAEIVPGLGMIGATGALMIGMALALFGSSWIVRSEVLVIDRGLVGMTARRLTGARVWHEPLTGYRGIRARQEQRFHRYGPRIWHVVELWHPRTAKTVELARTRDPRAAEQIMGSWTRRLDLPLCRPTDEPHAHARTRTKDEDPAPPESAQPLPAA